MLHHRAATCHAARALSRQALAVRAIVQRRSAWVSVRAGQERAGLWPAGSWLRPGRWCRLLTATSPACRRCQCCSCCGCRCMSACARRHCCRSPERARTMRAWAAPFVHSTGSRGCARLTLQDGRRAARSQESDNKRRKGSFHCFLSNSCHLHLGFRVSHVGRLTVLHASFPLVHIMSRRFLSVLIFPPCLQYLHVGCILC